MYLVNTTFVVDTAINDRWLDVIKNRFLPFLNSEGIRIIAFSRVLGEGTGDGFTYSLLMDIPDMGVWQRYNDELFAEYVETIGKAFESGVLFFTTVMKKINTEQTPCES